MSSSDETNIIDLNLIKLELLYQCEENELRASVLDVLINEYMAGKIGVVWEDGEPLFCNNENDEYLSVNDLLLDSY